MRSAVTISLVPEAKGGPFVFWNDLSAAARIASELGFDALEIFPPDAAAVRAEGIGAALREHKLSVAAVGTGAGWVKHKLSLTSPDVEVRQRARSFISEIIDAAAGLGAPAIIGSLQGRAETGVARDERMSWLAEALFELSARAALYDQILLIEPLNRYETNLLNSVEQGVTLVAEVGAENLRLLLDVFHMNIEESDIGASIRKAGGAVGHVHFVDSNRRAVGMGHIDYAPIISALHNIHYDGYLSAEVLALPDSVAAAEQTIRAFHEFAP